MKHAAQTFALVLALLGCAAVTSSAQDDTPKPEQPRQDARPPSGPDDLYAPLPTEGLFEGAVPQRTFKTVILLAPMPGGADDVMEDLPEWMRAAAGGLRLMLEQQIDYLPQLHTEQNPRRLMRYHARLRGDNVPRPGMEIAAGQKVEVIESVARSLGADYALVLSFTLATEEQPAKALLTRYHRTDGVGKLIEIALARPDKDQPDRMATALDQAARDATEDIGATLDSDGAAKPVPHAQIPKLVKLDKSLKPFVEMRTQVELGEYNRAWIAWEELRKLEPDCGRGALLAMEVFRSLASQQGTEELTEEMRVRCIRTAIEGLKHSPNDVMLRGSLPWNAFILHARTDWALGALKQALSIDPGHPKLLEWHALVEHYWNPDRTLQAKWILKQVEGKPTDGRIELVLGNLYFGTQNYAEGVEWYLKGIKLAPLEHELHFSLGLCGTYAGEQLIKRDLPGEAGAADRKQADEFFALASDHMWEAISLDPLEVDYAYDFYLRSVTNSHTVLPSRLEDVDRLFLVWAARDGMASTSRTGKLDRVTAPLIRDARIAARKAAKAAKPGDEHFALHAMARLHFAAADSDKDEIIESLRVMKHYGLRPDIYHGFMRTYGPLVK